MRHAADNLLQRNNDMRCNDHRVYVKMRLGSVTPSADDADKKRIHRSHVLALPYTDLARFHAWHGMLTDYSLNSGIFQHTIADHMTCASGNHFLTRLKEKLHCTFECVTECVNDMRRPQE